MPEKIHAMLDLETMGTGPAAPLFQIGVAAFELGGSVKSVLRLDVNLQDVMICTGRMPDADTLRWWRTQDWRFNGGEITLRYALECVSTFFQEQKVDHVWANSPSFDCVILSGHYEDMKMPTPWSFRQELDMRTMVWLLDPERKFRPDFVGKRHDALDDCKHQEVWLNTMWKDYARRHLFTIPEGGI